MKLKVTKIKNLSAGKSFPVDATPAVGGGYHSSCGVDCGCGDLGGDQPVIWLPQ
ncbi:hypothetical protein [Pseudoalteromonas sp. R3]|uniref:hypothetical protein n=1 Tax=Pseudoalteromonas sp. R3 TaxID=1709477 RepID=UPI000ABDCDEB|nr:hypothetical protein [Pseudoalteromonas sp. R3]